MSARLNRNKKNQLILHPLMSFSDLNRDKNDLFVLRKCAVYLSRYLRKSFILRDETMEFICWVLGARRMELAEKLVALSSPGDKQDLQESMRETDVNDFPRVAMRAVQGMKPSDREKAGKYILDMLETGAAESRYRGLSDIEKNIKRLGKVFSLTENEKEVLVYFFVSSVYDKAECFFHHHLECNRFYGRGLLKTILNTDHYALNGILDGTLVKAGILQIEKYSADLSHEITCLIEGPPGKKISGHFYSDIPKNPLPLEYHMAGSEEVGHLMRILGNKTSSPTHVLLYGPPGTGKTSFVHGLAKKLGVPAYEIGKTASNASRDRRTSIAACLNMTNTGSGSLVIVDEADNILNTRYSWLRRGETQDKGWLNQLLDEPGVRMIWVTNDVTDIEASVLRRFAYSLEFKPFTREQRIRVWGNIVARNRCKTCFSEADIAALARKYDVSPGAIDLAVKKALGLKPCSRADIHRAVHLGLEAHRKLINPGETPCHGNEIETAYSLDGLNISGDVNALFFQLERFDAYLRGSFRGDVRNLNLLFHGPPGTGKSEMARYIAHRLDREIMCRSAGNILDPYVGMTERNLRQAFEEAEREGAVLVLDEVDSLLYPRENAVRSWEVSFTNELLNQAERFSGILICTTNRLPAVDNAAIRRFNQKIGFDYLLPEGNVIFYRKLLQPMITDPMDSRTQSALRKLVNLAPGDFRVVRDRFAFFPPEEQSHERFLQSLKAESSIKDTHKGLKPIGF